MLMPANYFNCVFIFTMVTVFLYLYIYIYLIFFKHVTVNEVMVRPGMVDCQYIFLLC